MKSMRKAKYYGRWGGKKTILQGVIRRHPDGFGFLIPDDSSHPDVFIPSGGIGSAMTNDRVEISVQKRRGRGNLYFGAVEAVLKRFREFAAGPYESLRGGEGESAGGGGSAESWAGALFSHNLSGGQAIMVSNPRGLAVKQGDWIRAQITSWPEEGRPFAGEITENLGAISSSAADDCKRVLAERDIPFEFPEDVRREAALIPDEVQESDFSGRKDLRGKSFVTIDGADAKDFDDAIYAEARPFGFRLWTAIADVSHYVAEGSALDKEAFERGNSSYLPGFCAPMLPEKLSNGLCSLNPGRARLAMIGEMDFSSKGRMIRSELYPGVIKSRRRLTYGEAQEMLDGFRPMKGPDGEGLSFLKEAERLARLLCKKTSRGGALDLDIPETVVIVSQKGEPADLLRERRLFTHKMIEQFMLAANTAASAFLEKNRLPLMYRIHEGPKKEKLLQLEAFSRTLGFARPLDSRKRLIQFLAGFQDHSKKALISRLVLRALSQARYSAKNLGHYGLNFKSYTHFTSPIRRYCDLVIHRQIKQALAGREKPPGRRGPGPEEMEKTAAFISHREQNAVKAERQAKDIKKARFLAPYMGRKFSGVISSVTSFGLFAALDDFDVEGLARFRELPGQWIADEVNLRAVSKRSGFTLKFGDKVEVQLAAARPLSGELDFKLISHEGRPLPKEPHARRGGRAPKPGRGAEARWAGGAKGAGKSARPRKQRKTRRRRK